jgi:DNA-binding SARP family transcriptional activator
MASKGLASTQARPLPVRTNWALRWHLSSLPIQGTQALQASIAISRPAPDSDMKLCLFGALRLCRGGHDVVLQLSAQRLIALVALRTVLRRAEAGGLLWPDVPDARAAARLRTALWRLRRSGLDVLIAANGQLFVRDGIDVDYRDWMALALQIIDRPESVMEVDLGSLRPHGELLPGWYDDWILIERERARQVQLHALEVAAEQLLRHGRHAVALEFALGALRMEQTRESAHRLAIRVHLAEGNHGEAWRQFELCERVLGTELGIRPSSQLRALVTSQPGHAGNGRNVA